VFSQTEGPQNVFFNSRFVEGICPNKECGYEDARGDQVCLVKDSMYDQLKYFIHDSLQLCLH